MSKCAVYAGSFDPFTLGHLSVLQHALRVFDRVIVGIGQSSVKQTLFSAEERLQLVKELLKDIKGAEVAVYSGLTTEFAKSVGAVALVRGLRSVGDFDFELTMAQMNRHLAPSIETLFFPSDSEYFHVSSTWVKDVAKHGGNLEGLVDPLVSQQLAEKFQ